MAQTGFTTYLVKGMVVGEPVQQVCYRDRCMRTCTARMTEDIIPKVPPAAPDSPEHPKLLDLPNGKVFLDTILAAASQGQ